MQGLPRRLFITCPPALPLMLLITLTPPSFTNSLLEKSITDIPKQYAVYAWGMDSAIGSHIAQDFLINNWARVYQAFAKSDTFLFPEVLNGAFGSITTQEELDKVFVECVNNETRLSVSGANPTDQSFFHGYKS